MAPQIFYDGMHLQNPYYTAYNFLSKSCNIQARDPSLYNTSPVMQVLDQSFASRKDVIDPNASRANRPLRPLSSNYSYATTNNALQHYFSNLNLSFQASFLFRINSTLSLSVHQRFSAKLLGSSSRIHFRTWITLYKKSVTRKCHLGYL